MDVGGFSRAAPSAGGYFPEVEPGQIEELGADSFIAEMRPTIYPKLEENSTDAVISRVVAERKSILIPLMKKGAFSVLQDDQGTRVCVSNREHFRATVRDLVQDVADELDLEPECESHIADLVAQQVIKQLWITHQQMTSELHGQIGALHDVLVDNRSYPSDTIDKLEESIQELMKVEHDQLAGDTAELAGHGIKHMNNVLLKRLATALDIPGVDPPISEGVDSTSILDFLTRVSPQFHAKWQQLGELYAHYQGTTRFLETLEAEELQKEIDTLIAEAFEREDAFEELGSPEGLSRLLDQATANDFYLMVRSTGAEDAAGAVNAGGNISVEYVTPDRKIWCRAVGKVVRSYFAYDSLQNRMNAGQNPYIMPLQLAVTTQPLIGEPIGGATDPNDIPISLVLFSDEPLYTAGESFRVMRISASYGHGNAVVGNVGIATDTVLVLISETTGKLYAMYDNKDKPYRLAPVRQPDGSATLDRVANPTKLRDQPTLTPEMLARLYQWAIVAEKFFGHKATDQEMVIKRGVIYPVQAREVKRPEMLPTYLDMRKIAEELTETPISQTLQGEPLVPGTASLLTITNREEVLVAATLEEAEALYDGGKHKLIVVSKTETELSHPVVNFSDLGVPCLVVSDLNALEDLLNTIEERRSLAVCVQTAALHLWENDKGNLDSFVSKGFAVHPAKIAISIPTRVAGPATKPLREIPQEVKNLLIAIRAATTHEVALQKLAELKTLPFISRARQWAKQQFPADASLHPVLRDRFEAIQVFGAKLKEVSREAKAAIRNPVTGARLKPLLHMKALESLIVGKADKGSSVGQFSIIDVVALSTETEQLIDYQSELTHSAHLIDLLLVGNKSFSNEGRAQWREFLMHLESTIEQGVISPALVKRFMDFMDILKQADVLPYWLTFYFAPICRNRPPGDASSLVNQLLDTLPASDLPLIESQLKQRKELQAIRSEISRFSDPKSFAKAWTTLLTYTSREQQEALGNQMKTASPLARAAALNTMNELVDTFDNAIKAMKLTPKEKLPYEKKVALFAEMLQHYLSLLTSWHEFLPGLGFAKLDLTAAVGEINRLAAAGSSPTTASSSTSTATQIIDQLRPSPDFSVAAALAVNVNAKYRHKPKTLEDYFTLIHQSLILDVTDLISQTISLEQQKQSTLPAELKNAVNTVSEGRYARKGNLTNLTVNEDQAEAKFTIPLNHHCAQLFLTYDKASGELTCKGSLLGQARMRWGACRRYAQILSKNAPDRFQFAAPIRQTKEEVTFVWRVSNENQLKDILTLFDDFCTISNAERDMDLHLDKTPLDPSWEEGYISSLITGRSHFKHQWLEDLAYYVAEGRTDLYDVAIKALNERPYTPQHWKLLTNLVKAGQAYPIAAQAVSPVSQDNWTILRRLVETGYAHDILIDQARQDNVWAWTVFSYLGDDQKLEFMKIFHREKIRGSRFWENLTHLVSKGPYLDIAQEALEELRGELSQTGQWTLLRTIISNGQGFDLAKAAFHTLGNHLDRPEQWQALLALVLKGQGNAIARDALRALHGKLDPQQWKILDCLTARGGNDDVARDVFSIAVQTPLDQPIQWQILTTLVQSGPLVDDLARSALEASESIGTLEQHNLLMALVMKDQALDILENYILNSSRVPWSMVKAVVSRGKAIDIALKALKVAQERNEKEAVRRICIALIGKVPHESFPEEVLKDPIFQRSLKTYHDRHR